MIQTAHAPSLHGSMEASVPIPDVETYAEGRRIGTSAIGESEERDEALCVGEGKRSHSQHCQPAYPEVIGMERSVFPLFLPLEAIIVIREVEVEDRPCLHRQLSAIRLQSHEERDFEGRVDQLVGLQFFIKRMKLSPSAHLPCHHVGVELIKLNTQLKSCGVACYASVEIL